MLKGIDPLLCGDLLKILDDMGHGDQLLLCDRNYPAAASGRPVVRLGDISVVRAARSIFSVFGLDYFVEHPGERMEVGDNPRMVTPMQDELLALAIEIAGRPVNLASLRDWISATGLSQYLLSCTPWKPSRTLVAFPKSGLVSRRS